MTTIAYGVLVCGIALSVPTLLFLAMLTASVWRDRQRANDAKRIAGGKQ
jgi:hypothetical protein